MAQEPNTILLSYEPGSNVTQLPNVSELKQQLEHGDEEKKILALKMAISLMLQGEKMPQLLMTIIRFVVPLKNHLLKKLLLIYWEIVPKKGADGKLLPEMILVCNALRNDLIHPNEYIRGSTLRYVCKLKEPELLEPLIPSVRNNLEHRHSYVRRNAVLALNSIYKEFDYLCPDAPELVYNFLLNEGDASCKRNAFIMLCNCAQEKAVEYLDSNADQIMSFGDVLQFAFIELIRKLCKQQITVSSRSRYTRAIVSLLNAESAAVKFEASSALLALSSSPLAIKAASTSFISLLCSQSDNNVKLIILDKLFEIKKKHTKVLQELVMDILRALSSPTMDIRQKTIDLAIDLVTPHNIDEVVLLLKKEVNRTQTAEFDNATEYRQMLIQAIHSCAVKFPDVAQSVVHVLMDFLGDTSASATDVIIFVREVVETYPDLRQSIIVKLLDCLETIKSPKVYRAALWIIGEYCITVEDIDKAFTAIKKGFGSLPFHSENKENVEEKDKNISGGPSVEKTATKVLEDGTYASQSAYNYSTETKKEEIPSLRALLFGGDFFLGSVACVTLTKMIVRLRQLKVKPIILNTVTAESMLAMTSVLTMGQHPLTVPQTQESGGATNAAPIVLKIDADNSERIIGCLNILLNTKSHENKPAEILIREGKVAFKEMLEEEKHSRDADFNGNKGEVEAHVDDPLVFRHLRPARQIGAGDFDDEYELDLYKATGLGEEEEDGISLKRVHQLTGFSDPLYAEAYINVHRYDIMLDVVVVNRTQDTLQNVSLELSTLGDLKLCERPQNYSIGPKGKIWIKANIKVSSTESGIIFSNLVYDIAGSAASDKNCVVLNDIHIDIIDYIVPATCTDVSYRSMWLEFEWENKVAINSYISDLNEFLDHITSVTNMKCLTPPSSREGSCGFLAANLYARSIFGEDALANVSVGYSNDGMISGYIRIRSKTQGIALSLGDKITLRQARKGESLLPFPTAGSSTSNVNASANASAHANAEAPVNSQ